MTDSPKSSSSTPLLLESAASGLASFTVDRLADQSPQALEAFGPLPRESWRRYLASRINELAAAVRAGQPRLFASQIDWCRVALTTREIPQTVLKDALQALEGVLREQSPQVVAEVEPFLHAAFATLASPIETDWPILDVETPHGSIAGQYVLAVLEGDRRQARRVIHDAVNGGYKVQTIYLDVLVPAAQEIGRMWHQNEVSVAEEHFVTTTTQMILSELHSRADFAEPNGKTVVAAAVNSNRHEMGIRVVADFFEMAGWRTIYLGADMPASDLAQAVVDFDADLIALAATLQTHLPATEAAIEGVRAMAKNGRPKVLVGGAAFAGMRELAMKIGADDYAEGPEDAVARGAALVGI